MVGSGTCCGYIPDTDPGADTGVVDIYKSPVNLRRRKLLPRPTSGFSDARVDRTLQTFLVGWEWGKVTVADRAEAAAVGSKGLPRNSGSVPSMAKNRTASRRSSCAQVSGSRLGNGGRQPRRKLGYPIAGVGCSGWRGLADLWGKFWVACPLVQVILAEFGASGRSGWFLPSRLPQLTKYSVAKLAVVGGWKLETTCVR